MIRKLSQRLKSPHAQLGLASLAVQLASFALLFSAKVQLTDQGFANLMTQAAFAGIIGSVATMRLEILIWQHFGRLTLAAVLVPVTVANAIIAVTLAAVFALSLSGLIRFEPSIWTGVLALGLGFSSAQDFLLIQSRRSDLVLASRLCQALMLFSVALVLGLNLAALDGPTVLALQGLSLLLPIGGWLTYHLYRHSAHEIAPVFLIPRPALVVRSMSLSFSVLINSIYVNLPLLAASATQTAGFTADFGLILRLLTGPVTLVRQVFGQMFQARGLEWAAKTHHRIADLQRLMHRTMMNSFVAYLAIASIIIVGLFLARGYARIEHPELSLILLFSVASQAVVTPVASIRTILCDEPAYVAWDVFRCLGLAAALFLLHWLPFALVFSIASCLLYISYYFFMQFRMKRAYPDSH